MSIVQRLVTLAIVLSLAACAGSHSPAAYDPTASSSSQTPADSSDKRHSHSFPRPPELEPQIAFWRNVFGVWSRGQVVFHDNRHLGLIYEVTTLPGNIESGYTHAQSSLIRERRDIWKARLQELERKAVANEPMSPAEQALMARITQIAGKGGIYGASERLRRQRGLREKFKRGLEISGRYDKVFSDIFRQAGLPEDLAYLPHIESSFQNHARSSAGASGMWQFTRPAAETYMNPHPAVDERLDPVMAAHGAARYLRDAYNRLGDWSLALTSYNHGIGGMKKAQAQFGNDFVGIVQYYDGPHFGFASRNFYAEFLAIRELVSQAQRYFPEGVYPEAPLDWDRVVLRQDASAAELALYYSVNNQQLLMMNPAWTKSARASRIALPEGTTIWLPNGTLKRIAQLGRGPQALAAANTASDEDSVLCRGENC